jgi:lauroyl/myristoyl acyltransferase
MSLRSLRQRVTSKASEAALRCAPWLSPRTIARLERLLTSAGPHLPVLARTVADNMRAVGVYSREAHRAYFAGVAAHLAATLHIFREATPELLGEAAGVATAPPAWANRTGPNLDIPPQLAAVLRERVQLDDTFDKVRSAYAEGRGVVLMGAHPVMSLLVISRLDQEIPITIYLRYAKDARRRATKRLWCNIARLDHVEEPPSTFDPSRRAAILADVLQRGRGLIITPDLPQKETDGTPVRFFDRELFLPTGPAALSVLTGSPLFMLLPRPTASGIRMECFGPYVETTDTHVRGWRRTAIQARMQWFTDLLIEELLKKHPGLWYLWGDKRWTRVFRGDERYGRKAL